MADGIFISHSSKDRAVVETICAALEARGLGCWLSSRDVLPGENYQEAVEAALHRAQVMVLVFSENANNSSEVKKELALASHYHTTVIPVRVEDIVPTGAFAYELATRQWIDLFADWERAIDRLTGQIGSVVGRPTVGNIPATPLKRTPLSPRPKPHRGWLLALAVIAVLATAGGAAWWLWPRPQSVPGPTVAQAPPASPTQPSAPPAATREQASPIQLSAPPATKEPAPPIQPSVPPAATREPASPMQPSKPAQPALPRPSVAGESCAGVYDTAGTLRYCASSVLAPQGGNSYAVGNLFDGNPATAWVEGKPGSGVGEWVAVEFAGERVMTAVNIANGYQKSSEAFQANSRVRRLRVTSSRGDTRSVALEDRMGWQRVPLDPPVKGSWLQFAIEDVFPGGKYSDTALSELKIDSDAVP